MQLGWNKGKKPHECRTTCAYFRQNSDDTFYENYALAIRLVRPPLGETGRPLLIPLYNKRKLISDIIVKSSLWIFIGFCSINI